MEPGEGSAAPKATVALPGTDVNPAGRAPARLAVHCSLATGGPGAATRHAPFGRPRHPLGTFPCGKVPRPPAGGRNLPQETGFLWKARKKSFLAISDLRRVSPLRRRPGGFPVAPWTPSGPIPICMDETSHKKQIPCGRQETGLPFFSRITKAFASAEATRGLSDRPLDPFGAHPCMSGRNIPQETKVLRKAGNEPTFLFSVSQRISPLWRRTKGFPIALWKPSAPCYK